MDKKIFYVSDNIPSNFHDGTLEDKYSCGIWKPSGLAIIPKGVPLYPYWIWWFCHYGRIFSNRNYGIFLIRDRRTLIHRSLITPGYFRFPFMGKEDLQIGDTWTSADYRGRGLAVFAIQRIMAEYIREDRKIWYLADESNKSSIRVAEKAGLIRWGEGVRKNGFGISVFGRYEIRSGKRKED